MIIKELLKQCKYELLNGNVEKNINKICYDNRKIEKGDIFVCIKGLKVDGHTFIEDAIKRGAAAIIVEDVVKSKDDITIIKVEDTRKTLAIISSNYFGNPKNKLKIIGITGTNGKTTSAFIIKSILENSGFKVGLIGTIANYIGNRKIHTERTTPESLELHELFNTMVNNKVEYCVMEVSSHSLELNRVYGIEFECGIFTNLTRDHLDFHKTFENYYKAKFKLFERSKFSLINIDDYYGLKIIEDIKKYKISTKTNTFSIDNESNFKAKGIKSNSNGSQFKILINSKEESFKINIPGLYNIYNALGCILCAYKLGISINSIINGIKNVIIPGRCESVAKDKNLPYSIIIDYAHTPDGLENILNTIKGFVETRIITIFGCGGDRDKIKRPQMGEIACKLSDLVIITSDNPRSEEPEQIIKDIITGIDYSNYITIENRKDAIKKAISLAKEGDVILIAGKGHETYQILKNETIHFDEREVIYDILEKN